MIDYSTADCSYWLTVPGFAGWLAAQDAGEEQAQDGSILTGQEGEAA